MHKNDFGKLFELSYFDKTYTYDGPYGSTKFSHNIIFVYVGDLVLARYNLTEITHIKTISDTHFSNKDLGNLKCFIGFEISRSPTCISLCQHKYCLDLLQETKYLGIQSCNTPMDPSSVCSSLGLPRNTSKQQS